MKKVTLSFPTHDALWLFKEKSTAINVAITPKKNTITGLFSLDEVDMAVKKFEAVQINGTSTATNTVAANRKERMTTVPSFKFRFSQLLSMLNFNLG